MSFTNLILWLKHLIIQNFCTAYIVNNLFKALLFHYSFSGVDRSRFFSFLQVSKETVSATLAWVSLYLIPWIRISQEYQTSAIMTNVLTLWPSHVDTLILEAMLVCTKVDAVRRMALLILFINNWPEHVPLFTDQVLPRHFVCELRVYFS